MAAVATDELRDTLRSLGERRRQAAVSDAELTTAITDALRQTQRVGITKTEAAQLLGVHRTTLYRVYNI